MWFQPQVLFHGAMATLNYQLWCLRYWYMFIPKTAPTVSEIPHGWNLWAHPPARIIFQFATGKNSLNWLGHSDGQGWLAASKDKHPIVFHHFLGVGWIWCCGKHRIIDQKFGTMVYHTPKLPKLPPKIGRSPNICQNNPHLHLFHSISETPIGSRLYGIGFTLQ